MYFQEIVRVLKEKWSEYGCAVIEPYTLEVGAGTLHPETVFRSISPKSSRIAYVQPSIRPTDGCYGENPNRLYQHHQFQVIIKPSDSNLIEFYFETLKALGISAITHDLNLLEDDWENPSIGAWGLGWEVSCNGMEITQITYIQQIGGVDCTAMVPTEITYGLERLAMQINKVDSVYNIPWNTPIDGNSQLSLTYGDLFFQNENEMSHAAKDSLIDPKKHRVIFNECMLMSESLLNDHPKAAYHYCIKAISSLNILDSLGDITQKERAKLIASTRTLVGKCCRKWLSKYGNGDQK